LGFLEAVHYAYAVIIKDMKHRNRAYVSIKVNKYIPPKKNGDLARQEKEEIAI
jgi:hypothetical protein